MDRPARRFALSVLMDLCEDQRVMVAVKEIAWDEGIGKFVGGRDVDLVAVSLIFGALHRDPVLRTMINTIMDREEVNQIIAGNEG